MKSFLLLFVVVLVIAACYPLDSVVTSGSGSDNSAASQKARADRAMQQAQQQEANAKAAAVNETAQAQAANGVLVIAATATAQALAVARAQLAMTAAEAQTTATAQAMSAQQTAQVIEAKATIDARAMLLAQQQAQATATAQAMQREGITAEEAAQTSQQQNVLISWLIPIIAAIAFGLVLLLGAKIIAGMIDAANEGRSLENQKLALLGTLFDKPTETIVFGDIPRTGNTTPRLLDEPNNREGADISGSVTSHWPEIDTEVPPVILILSNGDKMLADSAEAREEAARCKLAMKLIRDAIDHLGAQSNRIPPAAQLGWPGGAWTIAVAILRPYGVEILQGQDGGTYLVGQYPTLQALYIAIGERRLTL